jgi:enoyl-CoA hydratase/carnithine racemase
MDYEHLLYEKEDGIAVLTMNRPQALNAFTVEMYRGMEELIKDAASDEDIRVLVITGKGRGFCVGADVKSLEQGLEDKSQQMLDEQAVANATSKLLPLMLWSMSKPVLASINGITAGGGLDAACACDIRIASDKATFSSVFVRRGIVPTLGGTYLLPRLIGIDRACELIWTGDLIDAREAERIGLVTRVVPHDQLAAATEELALKLAKGPPLAIAKSKQLIYEGLSVGLEPALREIMRAYAELSQSDDHREALNAFLEKRAPVFRGR